MASSLYSSRSTSNVGHMTHSMAKSMKGMNDALTCYLCHNFLDQPRTLSACGHSFCFACIEDYSKNNWHCPVPGCGQAMTLVGNRKGKFHCTNPSLETLATSFQAIQQTLRQAPSEWWKDKKANDEDAATNSKNNDDEATTHDNTHDARIGDPEKEGLPNLPHESANITLRTNRNAQSSVENWTMDLALPPHQHEDEDSMEGSDDGSRNLLEDDE